MDASEFDAGFVAGLRAALRAVEEAEAMTNAQDDDKRGFQKACYARAFDMAKRYVNKTISQMSHATRGS